MASRQSRLVTVTDVYAGSLTASIVPYSSAVGPQYGALRQKKKLKSNKVKLESIERKVPCSELMAFHQDHINGS